MTEPRDVEDQLRAVLRGAADSARPPVGLADRLIKSGSMDGVARPHDERKDSGIRSARLAERRRRWLLPAVSAAAVVAVVIGIAVGIAQIRSPGRTVTATPATPDEVVPWTGTGVHVLSPSELTTRPDPAAPNGMRDCGGVDFAVVTARSAPTPDGWVATTYLLRSIATSDCAVSNSFSSPTLVDAAGAVLPNDAGLPAGPARHPGRLLVQPGEFLSGEVDWARVKGLTSEPTRLVLFGSQTPGAAAGAGLSISLAGVTAPSHPTSTNSGPWRAGSIAPPPAVIRPGSLGSLTAVMHLKSPAVQGTVHRYTVELHNPTSAPISLSPCPDFVEQILVITGTGDKAITAWGGPLNCGQAPAAIGPNSSVTFAFELDTASLSAGTGYVSWSLAVGGQMFSPTSPNAQITITH